MAFVFFIATKIYMYLLSVLGSKIVTIHHCSSNHYFCLGISPLFFILNHSWTNNIIVTGTCGSMPCNDISNVFDVGRYGNKKMGPIPPNSTLEFDIQLIRLQ